MLRRRLTNEEACTKLDDIVGLITDLVYTCSDEEIRHLCKAGDELTKIMNAREDNMRKEKR